MAKDNAAAQAAQDARKRNAARAALDIVLPQLDAKSILGIGTGSTANAFIDLLAGARDAFDAAVASSEATRERLEGHGIRVIDLNAAGPLCHYIDGADEADPRFNLVKGAGGALTREKIVAAAADEFICIVDPSKLVEILGACGVPVEVIPMARSVVGRALVGLGGEPEYRQGYVTDNGNLILDVWNLDCSDPPALESAINDIPGVVANGLFARRPADVLVVGSDDGAEVRRRPSPGS